jgi:hypothetical protein
MLFVIYSTILPRQSCIASNELRMWIVINELEGMWKEIDTIYSKALSMHFTGGIV